MRRNERPDEPSAILQGVNTADLRKDMARELRLEGDNRIFRPATPDVPVARIGEEAVAIEYRLDRGRALCRLALRRRPRQGCEPKDSRCYPTCAVLSCLCLDLRLVAIGEELDRETGAAAIPSRRNGLVPFINRDR